MIREELVKAIEEQARIELEEANKGHKLFNSPHEGWAVLKEEVEEADMELEEVENALEVMWNGIKYDMDRETSDAEDIRLSAIGAAAECVQVAAMCMKIQNARKNNYKI